MNGNISIGFMDGRAHNRVLKPPGGGYSEIFFNSEEESPKKPPPARSECLIEGILRSENSKDVEKTSKESKHVEEVHEKVSQLTIEETSESVVQNGEEVEESKHDDEVKEELKTNEKKIEPATPEPKTPDQDRSQSGRKGRVPPGGYSTALW